MDPENGLQLWNVHQQASLCCHQRSSTKENVYTVAGPADDADTLFAHSDKGFITDNLALDWLHHFDTWTNVSDRDVGPDTISDTFRARTLHHPCALKME